MAIQGQEPGFLEGTDGVDDESRLADIWRRYGGRVLAYAAMRVGQEDAADATSEAFLSLWRNMSDVRVGREFDFLVRQLRWMEQNRERTSQRSDALTDRLVVHQDPADLIIRDHADVVVENDAIVAALASLSPSDRELLVALAWEGMTPGDLAKRWRVKSGVMQLRVYRARRRLEAALEVAESNEGGPRAAS